MAALLRFIWDSAKAEANRKKHGVSFDEATSVFTDAHLHMYQDQVHPERFVAIGYSEIARLLVVVHIEEDEEIRLISARKATPHERKIYADQA